MHVYTHRYNGALKIIKRFSSGLQAEKSNVENTFREFISLKNIRLFIDKISRVNASHFSRWFFPKHLYKF